MPGDGGPTHHIAPTASGRNCRGGVAARLGRLLLLVTLAGCASLRPPMAASESGYRPPTAVSAATVLAPSGMAVEAEIDQLTRHRTVPALLRRAWLELGQRHPQQALDITSEVLYAATPPSPHDESFARYVRAEAYAQMGQPERGRYDLERAQQLASDPELVQRLLPRAAPPVASAPTVAPASAVEPRQSWRPRSPNPRNLEVMQQPTRVTIHHSAMYFRDTRPAACAAQIQRIQREHMQVRGYGDIGYHFLIDPSGRVWEGRELRWQGAHASGEHNVGNIGICLLGNFLRSRDGQGPTSEQLASMERLVVELMQRFRISGEALHCHSDFKATECPGPRLAPLVQQLARELRHGSAHLAAGDD